MPMKCKLEPNGTFLSSKLLSIRQWYHIILRVLVSTFIKSAAFSATYCVIYLSVLCHLRNRLLFISLSLEGLQSGKRSGCHLLRIHRNLDFVPIPLSFVSKLLKCLSNFLKKQIHWHFRKRGFQVRCQILRQGGKLVTLYVMLRVEASNWVIGTRWRARLPTFLWQTKVTASQPKAHLR